MAHTRQIVCTGYARDDGLYDIEASMQDTKGHHSSMVFKEVPAGGAIHDMWLKLTVDADLVIRDACALTHAAPTPYCTGINDAYAKLIGIRIGSGFMKEVKARLGGVNGCTHLSELLGPAATTAFQTIMGLHNGMLANLGDSGKEGGKNSGKNSARRGDSGDSARAPVLSMLNTCHAWRADGEVVRLARQRRDEQAAQGHAEAG